MTKLNGYQELAYYAGGHKPALSIMFAVCAPVACALTICLYAISQLLPISPLGTLAWGALARVIIPHLRDAMDDSLGAAERLLLMRRHPSQRGPR